MARRIQGPRPTQCCKCKKSIATEPGRAKTCLACQEKRRKERELAWVNAKLEENGDILLTCAKCSTRKVFENYKEPIKDNCAKIMTGPKKPDKMGSTIDRLNSHLEAFRKEHHHGAWNNRESKRQYLSVDAVTFILSHRKDNTGKNLSASSVAIGLKTDLGVQATEKTIRKVWSTNGKGKFPELNPKPKDHRGYSACSVWDSATPVTVARVSYR